MASYPCDFGKEDTQVEFDFGPEWRQTACMAPGVILGNDYSTKITCEITP